MINSFFAPFDLAYLSAFNCYKTEEIKGKSSLLWTLLKILHKDSYSPQAKKFSMGLLLIDLSFYKTYAIYVGKTPLFWISGLVNNLLKNKAAAYFILLKDLR